MGGRGGREPERTCVGCRTKRPRRELLRVVRSPEGRVAPDPGGRTPGRGAYVCRDRACVALATREGRALRGSGARLGSLARALRAALSPEDLARLRAEMERELT